MEKIVTDKKITQLRFWLVVTNIAIVFLLYRSLSHNILIDEVTAKKINIVGEDGGLRLVLSNESRQHSGRIENVNLPKRDRPSGIIFFNNEGNEAGGIINAVRSIDGKKNSGMSFTMDRYNHDQVIQILNSETFVDGNEEIERGLIINEFPKGSKFSDFNENYSRILQIKNKEERSKKLSKLFDEKGSRRRIFLGRNINNESGLTLYNQQGKPMIKIFINNKGKPRFEYLQTDGKMKNLLID